MICLPVSPVLSLRLRVGADGPGASRFPTDTLCRGLTLEHNGRDLSEEGVGFGVPVLKTGLQAVFAGACRLAFFDPARRRLGVRYTMDLRERLASTSLALLGSRLANSLKEIGALLHRAYPGARRAIGGLSRAVRTALGVRTIFEHGPSAGEIEVVYEYDPLTRKLSIVMDATALRAVGLTELILMNEQGASHFTEYWDSDGTRLRAEEIGAWSAVRAEEAGLRDPELQVGFSLAKRAGARFYRGREVEPGRFSWAGFAYLLPPATATFRCAVQIGEGQ